jgi:hypothetical protein
MWLVLHREIVSHFSGVVVFCVGSTLYSFSLLRLAGQREKKLEKVHLALEIFLFVSAAALVFSFGFVWAMEETRGDHVAHMGEQEEEPRQTAYILEHLAYLAFLLFYSTFFLFHTPDPLEPPALREIYTEEYAMDPEGVAMKPLLQPIRAAM